MHKEKKITISLPLLGILFILCFISCFAILSAAPLMRKIASPNTLWLKQFIFFGLSFILMGIVYKFGNERIYRLCWVLYGILILLLVGLAIQHFSVTRGGPALIPFAKTNNGATSWYTFKAINFDLQPSEFMKIILIICISKIISTHNNRYLIHTFSSDCLLLGKVAAVTLPPCILIYLQNDAGVTLIYLVSIAFILFSSGIQARWFVVGAIVAGAVLLTLAYVYVYQHEVFVKIIGGGYKMGRFYGWLNPEATYNGDGFQLFNALIALGTGGLFGHGFQSNVIFFPEAHTDFVFAVICQDYGFVGGIITVLVIAVFDAILIRIGFQSTDDKNKYFVSGIFGMLIFQQAWNIGMVLGLVPITGITLPLLSYGGSSLLSYMLAMGMFLDMDKQTKIVASKTHFKELV